DARGRVSKVEYGKPSSGAAVRTVTYAFKADAAAANAIDDDITGVVENDPRVSIVSDPNGRIVSMVDLLGRTIWSSDVYDTVTIPTYEPLTGRVLSTEVDPAGGDAVVQSFDY